MGRGQGFQAVNIREFKKTLHNCQSFQIHILIGLAAIFIDAFLPDLSYHLTLMMKNRRPTQNMERLTDLRLSKTETPLTGKITKLLRNSPYTLCVVH